MINEYVIAVTVACDAEGDEAQVPVKVPEASVAVATVFGNVLLVAATNVLEAVSPPATVRLVPTAEDWPVIM